MVKMNFWLTPAVYSAAGRVATATSARLQPPATTIRSRRVAGATKAGECPRLTARS